jgi:hypothetical protein
VSITDEVLNLPEEIAFQPPLPLSEQLLDPVHFCPVSGVTVSPSKGITGVEGSQPVAEEEKN